MNITYSKIFLTCAVFGMLFLTFDDFIPKLKGRPKQYPLRDYQIGITDSFTYIWDKGRLVDSIPFDKTNPFDKVFLKDNE